MFRLQVWLTQALNRRRRKKEIMFIYWELITERLKLLFAKSGAPALKKYGGTKILYAIESKSRKKVVLDFIVKTERDYIDQMIFYNKMMTEKPDRKERVVSKVLAYFVKKQLLERSYEAEINILEKNVNDELPLPDNARQKELQEAIERKKRFSKLLIANELPIGQLVAGP